MNFEFDPEKSRANKAKHGISLEMAGSLWLHIAVELGAKSIDEPRFMRIAKLKGKFYSCIYTRRGENIRLISARRSRKTEEKIYNDYFKT